MRISIINPNNGNAALVDDNGRVYALSVGKTTFQEAAENGDSYNINTGDIELTTAGKSAVLFFKNTGQDELVIPIIGFLLGNSNITGVDLNIEVLKNPTTGTIVSGATPVEINENKNAGSTKTLDVLAYKGAEGLTLTNGISWYKSLLAGAARGYPIDTGQLTLPAGSSMGVNITPPAGNTSMHLQVYMSVINNKEFKTT